MAADILLDASGDLAIINGDLVIGESDSQNIIDIIESFAGAWKQFPQVGVGVITFLNSINGAAALEAAIKTQLTADGFNTAGITVASTNQGLKITIGTLKNPVKRPGND